MTVYIPVPIEVEPPPIYGWVVFITEEHDEILGKVYPDGFRILYSNGLQSISNTDTVTHWLKKVESSNLEVQQIQDSYIKGYEAGAKDKDAEMVAFAEWCSKYDYVFYPEKGTWLSALSEDKFTAAQLLEKFREEQDKFKES